MKLARSHVRTRDGKRGDDHLGGERPAAVSQELPANQAHHPALTDDTTVSGQQLLHARPSPTRGRTQQLEIVELLQGAMLTSGTQARRAPSGASGVPARQLPHRAHLPMEAPPPGSAALRPRARTGRTRGSGRPGPAVPQQGVRGSRERSSPCAPHRMRVPEGTARHRESTRRWRARSCGRPRERLGVSRIDLIRECGSGRFTATLSISGRPSGPGRVVSTGSHRRTPANGADPPELPEVRDQAASCWAGERATCGWSAPPRTCRTRHPSTSTSMQCAGMQKRRNDRTWRDIASS